MFEEVTVVVGVDAKTLPQLEVSSRTWRLHRPEMYSRMPWVVFYDGDNLAVEHGVRRAMDEGAIPAGAEVVPWPQCLGLPKKIKYESQRERMLSGFVYVPRVAVRTKWWCKIDTDAVCLRRDTWPDPQWFAPDERGREPVVVASPWNYTKGVGWIAALEKWGDGTPHIKDFPRLNIPNDPTHMRVPHPRWCSWNSFYHTAWSVSVDQIVPGGKLPVPSQDTYHWYVAERMHEHVRKVSMKRAGWTNCPKMHTLVETVRKVMAGEEAITDG